MPRCTYLYGAPCDTDPHPRNPGALRLSGEVVWNMPVSWSASVWSDKGVDGNEGEKEPRTETLGGGRYIAIIREEMNS